MKLSVSAYRAHASAHKKILSSSYHSTPHYGSTTAAISSAPGLYAMEPTDSSIQHGNTSKFDINSECLTSPTGTINSGNEATTIFAGMHRDDEDSSNAPSVSSKSLSQRNKSNQRWMKLRTTVQISSAIQKKPPLKREDSFLKRFSTRQIPDTQETVEDTGSESASGDIDKTAKRRRRYLQKRRSVVNPDENFYFYWLMALCTCVLYNLWTLIVRQSFPELQKAIPAFWIFCDALTDVVFVVDVIVQLRTGYLEQGLMVYDDKKLACHYIQSRDFFFDVAALVPLDLLQIMLGAQPLLRFPRFLKVYRSVKFYYIVESRTVWPNLWRVVNLIHILLILAHWFGCFYYLLSEAEGFQGDWVYPYRPGDYATLTRKYLGSLYWSTLTLTTIGDLPTPETNAEPSNSADGPRSLPRRGIKSRLLQFGSNYGYVFTIVSYLIGVFIFATIVGQVGNVITNRNANRLEFERLLDGAKTYMRHHKVPGGMKRRVLRWYDYSWSRGRIQGGGDINTALGLLPDKLKTELALHVNLSVLKKVTIFQECQPEFLHDLVLKMKAYIFTPGDSICRKGEVAREMFIIADGILEVLSETGKVLTTMKAGDFFGEIGILNLDGLNKRTADVRSVGYSELFSLSREDVLAAMKDYPEAQEILQTLGRKRLMEVRCVNKKHAKAASDKEAHRLQLQQQQQQLQQQQQQQQPHIHPSDNSSENSTSKKITDKLKVRNIRSALKKSRAARRGNESLEMKPLHSTSPKHSKYTLKRMSRVKSDEDKVDQDEILELNDKTPSPIGAGLPLLHRLRLLKEKQDHEDRPVKPTPSQKSPTHSNVTSTLSPQESIQEEPECESNEGLPLIQKLQQLTIKNEMSPSEQIPMIMTTLTSPTSSIGKPIKNRLSIMDTSASETQSSKIPSLPLTQFKPPLKVSFREKLHALQFGTSSSTTSGDNANAKYESSMVTRADIESNANKSKIIPTISNKITKPSTTATAATTTAATSGTTLIKNLSELKKPQSSISLMSTDSSIKPWSKLKIATLISSNSYTSLTNCSGDDIITPIRVGSASNLSISTFENSESQLNLSSRTPIPPQFPSTSVPINSSIMREKPKFYQSVFDLSPEYSGLPFVKRLKILNERQRLAELESVVQTRSLSLDCSKTGFTMAGQNVTASQLYRSHSDASGIYSQFMSTPDGISSSTSTTATTSAASESSQFRLSQYLQEYSPLSPESNETPERRQLKNAANDDSAMAAMTTSKQHQQQQQEHQNGLMKAPTLEGPPNSANDTYLNIAGRSDAITKRPEHFQFLPADIKNFEHLSPCTPTTTPINQIDLLTATNRTEQYFLENQLNLSHSLSSSSNIGDNVGAHHFGVSSGVIKKDFHSIPSRINGNGLPAPEEYFNQILVGINNVISSNMHEMHTKFENQFSIMETEVRRRDAIIAELQSKINKLETEPSLEFNDASRNQHYQQETDQLSDEDDGDNDEDDHHLQGNNSSGSSGELLFLRGDSLDTVLSSSPPIFGEHSAPSQSTTRRFSADQSQHHHNTNPFSHGNGNNGRRYSSQRPWSDNQSNLMLSNVTGNITRVPENIILDIEDSSSSSTSSSKSNLEVDDILTEQPEHVHSNDWEVRMLAAELDKRERKRGASLSDNIGDLKKCSNLFRRRRKLSDTETECSESEPIEPPPARPRAGSLDQFNIQHGATGRIFKAMSIDRNKDKL